MNTITLKTHQHRLIANLRHAFTPRSMLGELLQNARRAKATRIDVAIDGDTLTVSDDGCGIADLQTLIFIAESGWDENLKSRENAFGLGVLSTLYFATTLSVHSGEQAFAAHTAAIINGDAITVHTKPARIGTEIRLTGVQSPDPSMRLCVWVVKELQRLCQAFPVAVVCNGAEIARPFADKTLPWRKTQMGKVLIDLKASPRQWRTFLQGLPISDTDQSQYHGGHHTVLLPDGTLAKLPDRQRLLNEAQDNQRIQAEFMQAAPEDGTGFVQHLGGDLDDILCEHHERTVGKDNCVSFEGMKLQIPQDRGRMHYVKVKVRVLRYPDGTLAVFHGPRRLERYASGGQPLVQAMLLAAQLSGAAKTASRRLRATPYTAWQTGQIICSKTGQFYLLTTVPVLSIGSRSRGIALYFHRNRLNLLNLHSI